MTCHNILANAFCYIASNDNNQSMPRYTCNCRRERPHMSKTLSTSEKSPMPTILSTVQLHMPHRNFAVATVMLVTVTYCSHNSALSCFILTETYDMLQQQEDLYFGHTNLGSHVQFQILKSRGVQTFCDGGQIFYCKSGGGQPFLHIATII